MVLCEHCCQPREVELLDVWEDRRFTLSTCCEPLQDEILWGLEHDPDWARGLLRELGIEQICGHQLRRLAADETGGLVLDWSLKLGCIGFGDARAFVAAHHEHAQPPVGWRFGQGLWNGPDLIGVVIVGRPAAQAFDQQRVVEVTRLCLRRDLPAALRWNGCSMLYAWAARQSVMRGFDRIITYTRADEDGGSLRAAGWICEGPAGGGTWNRTRRPRVDHGPPIRRFRWARKSAPARYKPRMALSNGVHNADLCGCSNDDCFAVR